MQKRQSLESHKTFSPLLYSPWNTQRSIADILNIDHTTVADVVEKQQMSEIHRPQPLLYNIWNAQKQDNDRKHFGAFPEVFMENLLYYHTEPLDIVFDPFGGGGTTVDVCKRMFRRYYVSDRKVIPGREKDIREHDIKDGLPDDLPKPKMVFLDPPYWKQSEGMYSEDAEDLGNMELEDFNDAMGRLLEAIEKRGVEKIAAVIQPTQYKNDWKWTDHIFDFDEMLSDYEIEARYILPYSTQQYLPQMVEKAKEARRCLSSFRDLVVWKRT